MQHIECKEMETEIKIFLYWILNFTIYFKRKKYRQEKQ